MEGEGKGEARELWKCGREMLLKVKRKREKEEMAKEKGERGIKKDFFGRSKKTLRSPKKGRGVEKGKEEEEGIGEYDKMGEVMMSWREEWEKMMGKLRKDLREDYNKLRDKS